MACLYHFNILDMSDESREGVTDTNQADSSEQVDNELDNTTIYRRELLQKECDRIDLVIRSDSTLAERYTRNLLPAPWDVKQVAWEMKATQHLYMNQHANYKRILELTLRHIANAMRGKYPCVSWTTIWKHTKVHAARAVKYATIRAHYPQYPHLPLFDNIAS